MNPEDVNQYYWYSHVLQLYLSFLGLTMICIVDNKDMGIIQFYIFHLLLDEKLQTKD
jgi:hypothetical protein